MNNGTIKSAAQTFAQLQRVAGIALLLGSLRLSPDLLLAARLNVYEAVRGGFGVSARDFRILPSQPKYFVSLEYICTLKE